MNESTSRWLSWTGPLFTIGFVIALFALEGDTPGEKASAKEVMDYFNSHQGRSMASVFTAPLACLLLVLFFSHLKALARAAAPSSVGPTVMVSGAILWSSGILFGAVTTLLAVGSSDHGQEQVALTANVLSNDSWIPFIAGIAITLVGAGMTVLGTGILPSWMGWVALVAGIVSLLGPGGFLGFFVGPLWLLVAGVMLAMGSRAAAPATV
jgi:hypothetical protein